MAASTLANSPTKSPKKTDSNLTPPDEQFWIRYSPHYEMPLSWVGSGAIHFLIFGLLVLIGIAIPLLFSSPAPVPMDVVRLDVNGGGGGNVNGIGDKPGNANGEGDTNPLNDEKYDKKVRDVELPDTKNVAMVLPDLKDPDIARQIEKYGAAAKDIYQMPRTTLDELRRGVRPPKGEGGPGTGGGKGSGDGTGTGGGKGPGKEGGLSVREKRMLRWTMSFDIMNGADYARQLRALHVMIAVDIPGEPGKARVYDRIEPNAKGEVRELGSITRMPWVDGQADSVGKLCGYMGIHPMPRGIIAYMTQEMEDKLLKLEMNFHGVKDEDQIQETIFKIIPDGRGGYTPRVREQR
jgi:hypothetical protein